MRDSPPQAGKLHCANRHLRPLTGVTRSEGGENASACFGPSPRPSGRRFRINRNDKFAPFEQLIMVGNLETLRSFFLGVDEVVGVGTFEVFDFAVFEMPDAGGDFIKDVFVMGDEQDCAVVLL